MAETRPRLLDATQLHHLLLYYYYILLYSIVSVQISSNFVPP